MFREFKEFYRDFCFREKYKKMFTDFCSSATKKKKKIDWLPDCPLSTTEIRSIPVIQICFEYWNYTLDPLQKLYDLVDTVHQLTWNWYLELYLSINFVNKHLKISFPCHIWWSFLEKEKPERRLIWALI